MSETVESRLLALAEKATASSDLNLGSSGWRLEDEALIAACDPDTIARLCRVVEAVRGLRLDDPDLRGKVWPTRLALNLTRVLEAMHALDGGETCE